MHENVTICQYRSQTVIEQHKRPRLPPPPGEARRPLRPRTIHQETATKVQENHRETTRDNQETTPREPQRGSQQETDTRTLLTKCFPRPPCFPPFTVGIGEQGTCACLIVAPAGFKRAANVFLQVLAGCRLFKTKGGPFSRQKVGHVLSLQ